MRNLWLIAKHEYLNTVTRRGFLLLLAAVPLGIVALVGMGIFVESMSRDTTPIGYVDQAGFLDARLHATLPDAAERIQIRSFVDEEAARAALEQGQIQAYYVFPPDYLSSLQTEVYYLQDEPSGDARQDLEEFVRVNLVSSYPAEVQERLLEGPSVTVHDVASNRTFSENEIANIILPFVATFLFFFATMSSAGYMLGVVASEKENRTVEVMMTSVTPEQLIGGKTLGLLAASLSQLAAYLVVGIIGVRVAAAYVPELQQIQMPWGYLGVMALFFFPSYALITGVMVALGAAVTNMEQGQQAAGLLNLLFVLPLFILPVLFSNPGHPLIVAFTLFPTTSFLTISLRWGLGTVPWWQIGLSWALLVATATLSIWAAARVFRAGMLRYGKPLNLKAVVAAVRG
ncbi:MAG: ABC transporter permease [Anaerolineae bacterium]